MMSQTAGFLFPIAAMTLMLWLLWSESLRARAKHPAWHLSRVTLYLAMAAVMVFNGWRYRWAFTTFNFVLLALAALVGLVGAGYFLRKAFPRKTR
ncbi:MAG: hypothetical protein LC732_12310 [Acidobacteria bacterium]|nr:hypothetical protein [Acidobacteriota bacterium]